MRATPWKAAAIAAALALTAGCGKKAPKELPPAPQEETTGETTDDGEDASAGGVGTENLPGSRGAFLAAVGMGGRPCLDGRPRPAEAAGGGGFSRREIGR